MRSYLQNKYPVLSGQGIFLAQHTHNLKKCALVRLPVGMLESVFHFRGPHDGKRKFSLDLVAREMIPLVPRYYIEREVEGRGGGGGSLNYDGSPLEGTFRFHCHSPPLYCTEDGQPATERWGHSKNIHRLFLPCTCYRLSVVGLVVGNLRPI